jgi:hypothetical protein
MGNRIFVDPYIDIAPDLRGASSKIVSKSKRQPAASSRFTNMELDGARTQKIDGPAPGAELNEEDLSDMLPSGRQTTFGNRTASAMCSRSERV